MKSSIFNLAGLGIIFLLANCGSSDPAKVYRFNLAMNVDGIARTYLLNLPPNYYNGSSAFPLVIGMHGTGGSAEQFDRDYGLTQRANNSQFIVVYPEGIPNDRVLKLRTWNAGTCCDYAQEHNIDDVKFIRELIDELISTYKVDAKKVYATGMSNGGMMAYRLACEIPEKVTAIATVSCSMMVEQPCQPSRPVPVLHIHALPDTKIPYAGGTGLAGYYYPPVDSVLDVWSNRNGCAVKGEVLVDNSSYKHTRWSACTGGATVECYLTQDGGHAWPGGLKSSAWADMPSTAFHASDLILDFFQQFSR